ncbi:variable large family protein (plasmid) [Borrelia coriaceae]|uniref:Variable large protein n=1 Tax=Borrelia coriaceae ATCC 43381 TaxID=1408429 RepID=W5SY61_9SPIR|nr:variable large family protein [Borrelia coriaceae]AHH11638.1 Variable outer membrane protein [Borrelia coriaceae ATCC 43381]UPA17136.1 variable large family protein [Borrelia coriaceae]
MKINIKNIKVKSICVTLFISLFLACNNGIEELEKRNTFLSSLANLGNDFLSVFTSFGDTLGGVLGFNAETKKSDVGKYFKNIENNLTTTKTKLEKIVDDMKNENNPNAIGVETEVKKLISEKLNKIIEGAKTISVAIGDASELIANVATGTAGGTAGGEVDNLVKGMKSIVEVVLKEGKHDAGTEKKADVLGARNGNAEGEAGKLFASDQAGSDASNAKKAAADAAKAVGAITGADILQAMVKAGGDAAKLASGASAPDAKKDAVIAGGIALRAMAKNGKFANRSDANEYAPEVKGVVISAVTKVLDTLTIAIRKTVDEGLKTVKEAMKINSDVTPVTTGAGAVTK